MKKLLSLIITLVLIASFMICGSMVAFADDGTGDITDIMKFIRPELFILIIFLYVVGLFLKLWERFKQEWSIPYILLGISIIATLAYIGIVLGEGFSPSMIVSGIIQAFLIAAVPVFVNQALKQAIVKRKE